jgi:hypothetical protein
MDPMEHLESKLPMVENNQTEEIGEVPCCHPLLASVEMAEMREMVQLTWMGMEVRQSWGLHRLLLKAHYELPTLPLMNTVEVLFGVD